MGIAQDSTILGCGKNKVGLFLIQLGKISKTIHFKNEQWGNFFVLKKYITFVHFRIRALK